MVEFALGSREVGICARNAPEAVVKRFDGVRELRMSGRDCSRNALQYPRNPEEMRRVEGGILEKRVVVERVFREGRKFGGGEGR